MNIHQKIAIVTHELVYGVPQALRDYLVKEKFSHLLFISLPFLEAKKASRILYKRGEKIGETTFYRKKSYGVLDYFLDFFLVIFWILRTTYVYDLFIGVNNLNSLAGLVLKKIGKVKKVVFYTMDFVPVRFNNKLLNYIYHKIEIICIKNCDEVWNVSPRMAEGREKYLGLSAKKYPQRFIPVGTWVDRIKKRKFEQIKKNQILFIGHILEKQGLQKVIEALPKVVREIGEVKFLIIGGGDYETVLKSKVKKLNLEKNVIFKGWVLDRKKIDEMLSESAVAIATYKPEEEWLHNFTYYADPYKIKDYLGAGLAMILTDVSYNVKDVEKNGCGIIVKYDENEIANAIITLLKDKKVLKKYRANSLKYIKNYDWSKIFERALNSTSN